MYHVINCILKRIIVKYSLDIVQTYKLILQIKYFPFKTYFVDIIL